MLDLAFVTMELLPEAIWKKSYCASLSKSTNLH